ncbi:MAG: nuclear transport factor 2 family protein [Rhizorhabdus sp.]|uniref:nuclear transport factor 2 family protein n=1 Tax=Rhizorhabdus sp. TaxID=1968843 RepID=UPI001B75E952|nr:nuclear transport factor 2 family protein [Rhizorhabdus sp.]MBP8232154.1 nuclear transport factor 2 family protein [Rhizorhabdus sp.]
MTTEANKALIRDFLEAFSSGDVDRLKTMMTDDGTWWVSGSIEGMSGSYGRDPLADLLRAVKPVYKEGSLRITPTSMIAEADRVAVEASCEEELADGRIYANRYHFLFEIADEKVQRVKEYMDTLHAKETFFPA